MTGLCFLLHFMMYFSDYSFLATATGCLLTDCKFFMSSGRTGLQVKVQLWKKGQEIRSIVHQQQRSAPLFPQYQTQPWAGRWSWKKDVCAPVHQGFKLEGECSLLSSRAWCHCRSLTHQKFSHVLQHVAGSCYQGTHALADSYSLTLLCSSPKLCS